MSEVLNVLINASERAAAVARACCGDENVEGALVIAEKSADSANTRFDHDFKTIADVLAQESARAEIATRCPSLAKNIRGEETTEISGVHIKLEDNIDDTAKTLSSIIDAVAAQRLAEAAHSSPWISIIKDVELPSIDSSELGVWIDPIDATLEFISGAKGEAAPCSGLSCVTVLIGAYLLSTGEPVIGVINQPFFNNGKGRILWGVCYGDTREYGGTDIETASTPTNTVLTSGGEDASIIKKFQESEWNVLSVPGAGHKLLKVALGESSAYIVSKGTTFRWDTCAPHAILRAKGGDVLCMKSHSPLTYNDPHDKDTQEYCNSGGIIAYTNTSVLLDILNILK